ncbi:MAG: multiheme c-type cytochrome [Urechidicola sp.]|nr:multiheme c-type cytochrome [Urechidicola sp.]
MALIFLTACSTDKKEEYSNIKEKTIVTKSTYIGSESCKACHQEEFKDWQGSHHDLAMQIADSISVLGDFRNKTIAFKKIKSTFFKKGNDFYVNTEGYDGNYADFKIEYTFGVTPLQQYLVKFDNGEYQCLSTAWDSVKNEWFSLLQPDLDINHGDRLHWTGSAMSWNMMCADCHSTNVHKNYDSKTDTYDTTFSLINVSCESCHGAASEHEKYYQNPLENGTPPKMYMYNEMESTELVDKCARCHSRRTQVTEYFDYQGDFMDHYAPSLLLDGLYEVDGQINDEVYVYGSFIQSKMYHEGVSCKDCHNVHSLKLKKQGNDLCMTCHEPSYNTEEHHFHPNNFEGSQCINCHMTGKIYMGNDFRRDHSFRVPRPDQSVKYSTPNACTGCHDDKSDEWTAKIIVDKYGSERVDHFSDHLLKGYYEDPSAFEILMSGKQYPDIARATAVNLYGSQPLSSEQLNRLTLYLRDSSALVRNEVVISLEQYQNDEIAKHIEPMLKDSLRMVRISAARYFNMSNQDVAAIENYKTANKEFLTALHLNADFSSGQHQIALYYQSKGNEEAAIKAYKRAIEIDGYNNRPRMNLALIYYNQGLTNKCEELYLKVIEQEPDFSYPYYMLGLLYNELSNDIKALEYLELATEKAPFNENAFYNYALKLQGIKKFKESIVVLKKGLEFAPYNERLLYVKLLGEANTNLISDAKATSVLLMQIAPNNNDYKQLYQQLSLGN